MARRVKTVWQGLLVLLIAGGGYLYKSCEAPAGQDSPLAVDAPQSSGDTPAAVDGSLRIAKAFRDKSSGVSSEGTATVERLLTDDNESPRHQRMILRLSNGMTVLVAHNIDIAPRVPVSEGDTITYRGQYEWNEKGGVIHWTHRDPRGRHPAGWISYRGQIYK
jgi:hypothetical protein